MDAKAARQICKDLEKPAFDKKAHFDTKSREGAGRRTRESRGMKR